MSKNMTLEEHQKWHDIIKFDLFNQRQQKISNAKNDNLIFIANSENAFAYSFAYLLFSNQITYISENEFYLGDKDFIFTKNTSSKEIKIFSESDNRLNRFAGYINKKSWFITKNKNYKIKSNFPLNGILSCSDLTNGFILDLENFKVE